MRAIPDMNFIHKKPIEIQTKIWKLQVWAFHGSVKCLPTSQPRRQRTSRLWLVANLLHPRASSISSIKTERIWFLKSVETAKLRRRSSHQPWRQTWSLNSANINKCSKMASASMHHLSNKSTTVVSSNRSRPTSNSNKTCKCSSNNSSRWQFPMGFSCRIRRASNLLALTSKSKFKIRNPEPGLVLQHRHRLLPKSRKEFKAR